MKCLVSVQKPDSKWMKYIDNLLNDVHPNIIKVKALNTAYEAGYRGLRITTGYEEENMISTFHGLFL